MKHVSKLKFLELISTY